MHHTAHCTHTADICACRLPRAHTCCRTHACVHATMSPQMRDTCRTRAAHKERKLPDFVVPGPQESQQLTWIQRKLPGHHPSLRALQPLWDSYQPPLLNHQLPLAPQPPLVSPQTAIGNNLLSICVGDPLRNTQAKYLLKHGPARTRAKRLPTGE